MENVFVAILLNGILLNNCALQGYLGISTVMGHADNTKKSAVMGAAVTAVMVLTAIVAWPVQTMVLAPKGLEYLQTMVFVAIILAVSALLGAVIKAEKAMGLWLPLVALNSAVLGMVISNHAMGLAESVCFAVGTAVGFWVLLEIFDSLRLKLNSPSIPKALRGMPITVLAAGIISMAIYAF